MLASRLQIPNVKADREQAYLIQRVRYTLTCWSYIADIIRSYSQAICSAEGFRMCTIDSIRSITGDTGLTWKRWAGQK